MTKYKPNSDKPYEEPGWKGLAIILWPVGVYFKVKAWFWKVTGKGDFWASPDR
ncbi:hypothetical protein J4T94_gp069 [Mycobacterium phage Krypton555]|uniref:Uncharacterized protein n=1 Tax=Mycobacterium phage Krypton555 TaxID=2015885 RepID=A0A222ZR26_9CAUD|nr:hypothetical protein J4T94_gp069 [Mycobacterium phage Krypton555]ASR87147.1 hypothetical protein KRYPTON555_123 [Mycobacterium phage Krypton555]